MAAGLADAVFDAAEPAASSLASNIARGWERLLTRIGIDSRRRDERPADRNVLHFDEPARRSRIAAEETRDRFGPTATRAREDPSCNETIRSANDRAYDEDAQLFRNKI